jgi:hypothetical protein
MHQANREAVFAWLDACNRKPKAERLLKFLNLLQKGVNFGKKAVYWIL